MSSETIYQRHGVIARWNKCAPYTVHRPDRESPVYFGQDRIAAIKYAQRVSQPKAVAKKIAAKWVDRLGWGFHPDTRGKDYRPSLAAPLIEEYERDMDALAELPLDQYAVAVEVMEKQLDSIARQMTARDNEP